MAEEIITNGDKLVSPEIPLSLPDIEGSTDPFAVLHKPGPIMSMPFPSGIPGNFNTNKQLQGDFNSGPVPGANPNNIQKAGTTEDLINAISGQMKDETLTKDKYKYARTYSYGAGQKNMNFDRYYNHPKFKELGFSPYRDNETYYNERSSWWDDFSRMSGQWGGLVWNGFKSVWGDEGEANDKMEKAMSIGQSTRGGFGGWVTNFGMNSAYTIGIMGELLVEDAMLALVEAGSFGTATPLVGATAYARNSMAFGKLFKAWKGTGDFIKGLKNAEKARDYWNTIKIGGVDAAKLLNPLERTRELASNFSRGKKGVDKLGDLALTQRTFGAFYRDLRELNLVRSESLLEGEGAGERYQQQVLDEFYAKNGRMPETPEEQKEIWERAQSVKTSVALANAPTIYITNKLVFDGLLDGFKPAAKVSEMFLKGSGRTLEKTAAKGLKLAETPVFGAGTKGLLGKGTDFLFKSAYSPLSKKYFLGNLAEGIQESSQEIITSAVTNYHDVIAQDPSQVGFYSALGALGKGTSEQFSLQGLDTFMQGYLMGSVIQGGTGFFKGGYNMFSGSSAKAKEQALETDNMILSSANAIAKNAVTFDAKNADVLSYINVLTNERNKAKESGDVKTEKDLENDIKLVHLQNLARTGNMGLVTEHIDDMLGLSDQELADAYNISQERGADVRKKLSEFKQSAEGYQRKYNYAKKNKPNEYDPWVYDPQKNPEAFQDEMIKYRAHEETVADMIFATEAYENTVNRMSAIGADLTGASGKIKLFNYFSGGNQISATAADDIGVLIDHIQRTSAKETIQNQIELMKDGTPEQKKEAKLLQGKLDLLREWDKVADNYVRELRSDRKAQTSPEEAMMRKKDARVRKGAIVKDPKTGKEYTVDSIDGDRAILSVEGNKFRSVKRRGLEVIKDAKGKPLEFESIEEDDLSHSVSMLYDTFKEYITNVAGLKRGHVFNDQMNDAFRKLMDFYTLDLDSVKMVDAINSFSDPNYFERYRESQEIIVKIQDKKRIDNLNKAVETFERASRLNKFLNKIFDLGVFVMPEDIKLLNKDLNNVEFYDITTKTFIAPGSDKYNKILEVVREYEEATGKTIKLKSEEPVATETGDVVQEGVEVVKVVTTSTPVGTIAVSAPGIFKSLVAAYNQLSQDEVDNLEPAFEAAGGTDAELIASEQFQRFVAEHSLARAILSEVKQEAPKPFKPKDPWGEGAKFSFSGTVQGKEYNQVPVEVIFNEGENYDDIRDVDIHPITLKNLNTGESIMIDLESEESTGYKNEEFPKEETFADEVISQEDYNTFIDTGNVAHNLLEEIAIRIKEGLKLSPYQTAIFTGKTGDINKLIEEMANAEPRVYRNIPVLESLQITSKTGEPGAAKYKDGKIYINPILLRRKYEEKAWTKSRILRDKSSAKTLPENIFKSYEEFENFVIEHEFQHSELSRSIFDMGKKDTTEGMYEDEINRRALQALGIGEAVIEFKDPFISYADITNLSELTAWEDEMIANFGNPFFEARFKEEGYAFNSDTTERLVDEKRKALANSLKFEDLNPGTVVKMKDGGLLVVSERNKKNVILVTLEDYKSGEIGKKRIIAKNQIKKDIRYMHSEFVNDIKDEAPITPKEVEENAKAIEVAKDAPEDNLGEISAAVKNAINSSAESIDNEFDNDLKNCKL
jgi:hypothetical protein